MFLNNPSLVCPYSVPDGEGRERGLVEAVRRVVPAWSGVKDDEVSVAPLTGGITNVLFKLYGRGAEPPELIVRLFGLGTSLLIDREQENIVLSGMSRLDVGSPTFFGLFENGRIEGYLAARAVTPQELHDARIFPRVAAALGKLHSLGPRLQGLHNRAPALFPKLQRIFSLAREVSFPSSSGNEKKRAQLEALGLDEMQRRMETLRDELAKESSNATAATLSAGGVRLSRGQDSRDTEADTDTEALVLEDIAGAEMAATVLAYDHALCHNDLLSGNVLLALSTDIDAPLSHLPGPGPTLPSLGSAPTCGVTLIDFEYVDYNPRAYDLANHFCEFAGFDSDFDNQFPTRATREAYLTHYLDAAAAAAAAVSSTADADADADAGTGVGSDSGTGSVEGVVESASAAKKILAAWAHLRDPASAPAHAPASAAQLQQCFVAALDRVVCRFLRASHLFWGSWAVVQSSISTIDFDYLGYASLRFHGWELHSEWEARLLA